MQQVTARNLPTNNKGTTGLKQEGFDIYGITVLNLFLFKRRMKLKRSFLQILPKQFLDSPIFVTKARSAHKL
jgi:hypothetical protein